VYLKIKTKITTASLRDADILTAQPGRGKGFPGELGIDAAQLAALTSQGCPWDPQTVITVRGDHAGGGHGLIGVPRVMVQHPGIVMDELADLVVRGL